jgi:23S rRNA (cytidine1920-2'-O)/16S rRNA (cytidine1409-2'-O)-methyltransferase
VSPAEAVVLQGPPPPYVSRGGVKLEAALERFAVDVVGKRALDAGASTGGFTDCLLQHGAAGVVAVDVGHGQLDARLRADPRVTVLERTHVRTLDDGVVPGGPVGVVTADLSFISLRSVAPVLVGPVVVPGGDVVVLVKPQFEAGRAQVSRGRGVVRDPAAWRAALVTVASALSAAGAAIMGAMPSPVTGTAGNTEFLLHALAGRTAVVDGRVRDLVDAAVGEAVASARPG